MSRKPRETWGTRVERQDVWVNVGFESLAQIRRVAAYDAAYLDLAIRKNLPLATSDKPLQDAASALGISLMS
jgi:predicted nucleic acid-binding protein